MLRHGRGGPGHRRAPPIEGSTAEFDTRRAGGQSRWFMSPFMRRAELEASPFLRDDRVVVKCSLAVTKAETTHH